MKKDKISMAFDEWKKRSTDKYINAICKPCWELKYCPYGVLIEEFQIINEVNDPYRCKIFGHVCPVFVVAEPLTESKQLRNISRIIPRTTQFRVLRRDDYICQECGLHVKDSEVNFDHVIPWSKGGSSDESNIRLLCGKCNKVRGNNYEEQYLVAHTHEVFKDPEAITNKMIADLLTLFFVAIELNKISGYITEENFCNTIHNDDRETDKFMYSLISNLWDLFESRPFFITVKKKEMILRYRWGLKDGVIHSIRETSQKFKIDTSYYCEIENLLLRQIGFILYLKEDMKQEYINWQIDTEDIKSFFQL